MKYEDGFFSKIATLTAAALGGLLLMLNIGSWIIGGIWLAIAGQWGLIVTGIILSIFMPWIYSLVAMPGIALAALMVKTVEKKQRLLTSTIAFITTIYEYGILGYWIVYVFWLFASRYPEVSLLPLILYGYSTATAPVSYMASQEGRNATGSVMGVFLSQIGYLLITVFAILGFPYSFINIILGIGIVTFAFFLSKQIQLAFPANTNEVEHKNINPDTNPDGLNEAQDVANDKVSWKLPATDDNIFNSSILTISLGVSKEGKSINIDLLGSGNCLVEFPRWTGDSVLIKQFICEIVANTTPDQVRIIIIDEKNGGGLQDFDVLPHLLTPVITDADRALSAYQWVLTETRKRNKLFNELSVKTIEEFNEKNSIPMEYLLIVTNNLSGIQEVAPSKVKEQFQSMSQDTRRFGIILLASTDKLRSSISKSFATRISYKASLDDDQVAYLANNKYRPVIVDIRKVDKYIIEKVLKHWKSESESHPVPNYEPPTEVYEDELFEEAWKEVSQVGKVTVAYLQSKLALGYNRASKIIDEMEKKGIVGPFDGVQPRVVLKKYEK